jgi:hypothetical protein
MASVFVLKWMASMFVINWIQVCGVLRAELSVPVCLEWEQQNAVNGPASVLAHLVSYVAIRAS